MAIPDWFSWGGWESERMEAHDASTYLLMAALTIIPLAFYLSWKARKEEGETSLPPGSRGLPLLGYLPFLKPDLHRCFADLARTYGPIVGLRLGSRLCVVLSSPATVEEALRDGDVIFANHDVPAVALASVYEGQDLVWLPYGPHWRMLRKVSVRELLSPANIESLSTVRRREVERMLEEVRRMAGEPVALGDLVSAVTMNATTMMMWGGRVSGEGNNLGREFRQVINDIIQGMGELNVSDFFPALAWLDLQGMGRQMRRLSSWVDRILDSIIEQRLSTAESGEEGSDAAAVVNKSRDFLQVMVELLRNGDSEAPLTMIHVKALFQDLVGAGIDTTTTTVEWAMAELLHNPHMMARVKEEIEAVVGTDGTVEEPHLPMLHYLDAVVREVLRLHPVFPLIPHRPSSTCTVREARWSSIFGLYTETPSFGSYASKFEPERFLSGGCKVDYTGNSFHYLPFGVGRRICPAMSLGKRMVKLILASLLHRIDWSLPDGVKLDLAEKFGFVMKKEQALVAVPMLQ
ncbi:hypothetical protein Taro_006675 [Colocasia esculenta]|uniref:Uncharacterized protein n=1 Tax=Colocasia esculenta TaxID=4460 RepID=A0A843TRV6_COLES|nr:hypothetical protein [Colocasia esculenta]